MEARARSSRRPRSRSPPAPTRRRQAVERAIETAKRIAARGGHAVVLVDTLDGLAAARRAPGAGRGARHRRRRLADGDRDRDARRSAARRRSSRLDAALHARRAASRRSTCARAARCARSCSSATRARDAIAAGARRGARLGAALSAACRRPGPRRARAPARRARRRGRAGRRRRCARPASKATSSSPSLTRWSSQAERKTRRRSQCTSERSLGPTSSGQQSLTCSPSAEAGSWISPLTARLTRSSSSGSSRRPATKPSFARPARSARRSRAR